MYSGIGLLSISAAVQRAQSGDKIILQPGFRHVLECLWALVVFSCIKMDASVHAYITDHDFTILPYHVGHTRAH